VPPAPRPRFPVLALKKYRSRAFVLMAEWRRGSYSGLTKAHVVMGMLLPSNLEKGGYSSNHHIHGNTEQWVDLHWQHNLITTLSESKFVPLNQVCFLVMPPRGCRDSLSDFASEKSAKPHNECLQPLCRNSLNYLEYFISRI
jgi:hypothetical protein